MAYSAIRYGEHARYIQDAWLGQILKAIFKIVDQAEVIEEKHTAWLLLAINEWWNDFENMPPGLKDIELNKWIIDESRKGSIPIC